MINKGAFPQWFMFRFLFFFFFVPPECFAQDMGLVLSQKGLLTEGEQFYGAVEYSGTATPWLAVPLGNKADMYVSGGFSLQYGGETWKPLSEVYRAEFIWDPTPNLRLEAGRVPFKETLSYVAAGLFDGLSIGLNLAGGRLNVGVFYTGLLYKMAAFIYMSPEDRRDLADREVYFASRRILAGFNWEKTSIFGSRGGLSFSVLGQIDLNGNDTDFHSQYLEAKLSLPLGTACNAITGAVVEMAEETGLMPYAAFALSTELQWRLPTALSDMITVTGRFSSGGWNEWIGAFTPITAEAQGKVLRPSLSGIAIAEAAYSARLHRVFSLEIFGIYYFRTDIATYAVPDMDAGSRSPLLGAEVYGGFTWSPFSDLLFSLGAGIFLPRTGKVFLETANMKYRVELTANISL